MNNELFFSLYSHHKIDPKKREFIRLAFELGLVDTISAEHYKTTVELGNKSSIHREVSADLKITLQDLIIPMPPE